MEGFLTGLAASPRGKLGSAGEADESNCCKSSGQKPSFSIQKTIAGHQHNFLDTLAQSVLKTRATKRLLERLEYIPAGKFNGARQSIAQGDLNSALSSRVPTVL
jgi:hypothetical protein